MVQDVVRFLGWPAAAHTTKSLTTPKTIRDDHRGNSPECNYLSGKWNHYSCRLF